MGGAGHHLLLPPLSRASVPKAGEQPTLGFEQKVTMRLLGSGVSRREWSRVYFWAK